MLPTSSLIGRPLPQVTGQIIEVEKTITLAAMHAPEQVKKATRGRSKRRGLGGSDRRNTLSDQQSTGLALGNVQHACGVPNGRFPGFFHVRRDQKLLGGTVITRLSWGRTAPVWPVVLRDVSRDPGGRHVELRVRHFTAFRVPGEPISQARDAPAPQLIVLTAFVAAGPGMGISLAAEPLECFWRYAHATPSDLSERSMRATIVPYTRSGNLRRRMPSATLSP